MDKRRIYGDKVSIDKDKVKDFYNRQVSASATKAGAVFLGSQDPGILEQKNAWCRDYIFPMLDVNGSTRVLDLGCGIGRWAEILLPQCGHYCGFDFSEEMIKEAEQTCRRVGGSFQLQCMSILNAAAQSAGSLGGAFNLVLISGVLVYLNDSDVEQIFSRLPNLLAERCTLYLGEPVGLEKRLTLRDFPSEALHAAYNAIYRTPEEYLGFYAPLLADGFSVVKREFMPKFGEHYTDTGRYYTILRR